METNHKNNKQWIWIVVGVVIVVIVAIVVLAGNHAAAPSTATTSATTAAANSASAQQTATPPYTSTSDGFSIAFPQTPQVTNSTFTSPTAGPVPLSEYEVLSSSNTGSAYYAVLVYHYPANYKFTSAYLSGALQEYKTVLARKYPGATITSQSAAQISGSPAISAVITVPATSIGSATVSNYVFITTKGNNAYIVTAYGMSQDVFSAFANSFTFTQ